MDILLTALGALWKVVSSSDCCSGPGFRRSSRSASARSTSGRVLVTDGGEIASRASRRGRAGAVACFSLCALGVIFGIIVIVFGKQLFS